MARQFKFRNSVAWIKNKIVQFSDTDAQLTTYCNIQRTTIVRNGRIMYPIIFNEIIQEITFQTIVFFPGGSTIKLAICLSRGRRPKKNRH
jgi:hypothetical protein